MKLRLSGINENIVTIADIQLVATLHETINSVLDQFSKKHAFRSQKVVYLKMWNVSLLLVSRGIPKTWKISWIISNQQNFVF